MGEDGHTASLFPGAPALGERAERAVAATGPKAPHRRMTVTPPVIEKARDAKDAADARDRAEEKAAVAEQNAPAKLGTLAELLSKAKDK